MSSLSTPTASSSRSRSLRLPSLLSRTPSNRASTSSSTPPAVVGAAHPSPLPLPPLSPSLTPSPSDQEGMLPTLTLPPSHSHPAALPPTRPLPLPPLLQPLSRPLSPLSSGLPSPTFSRPVSPFRTSAAAQPLQTPTPPLPVSVSLKTVNLPSPTVVEDILIPGDRIGVGLLLLGERIHPVPLGNHPLPEQGGEIADVVEVRRKIGEGSNACVYLVREVLGEEGKVPPPTSRGRSRRRGGEEELFGALELDDDDFPGSSRSSPHGSRPPPPKPTQYGREFAIKVLSKRDLSPSQIGTQLVEAQIHQSLPYHPNIVTLHRTLETKSWLLLILEHVPGEDLFYFLEQARDADHPALPPSALPSSMYATSGTAEQAVGEGYDSPLGVGVGVGTSDSGSAHTLHSSAPAGAEPIPTDPSGSPLLMGPLSHTPRTPSLLGSHSPSSLLSPQRLRLIARMFTQMCAAVAFCHEHGIAHRDIKPENFIVTEQTDEEGGMGERRVVVKLTDFGLASRERESRDVDCGSAPYMSFECANNVAPTYATQPADVWSLGIVLINMLYHQNPWPRATLEDPEGDGSAEAFAAFKRLGAEFLVERFPGVTISMAQWLVDKVFCDPDDRVGAEELGEWVLDLGGMVDEASVRLMRKAGRSKGRKDSVRKSKSKTRSSRRDAAVGRDRDELEGEEIVRGREKGSPEGGRDREREGGGSPSSSREPSLMKRRKRGARSNKSKNSAANSAASLPLPSALTAANGAVVGGGVAVGMQDQEAKQLQDAASMVEALAREASVMTASGRSGSKTPSLLAAAVEDNTPVPPLPMAPPVSPTATVRNRPSIEDDTWMRGRQPPQQLQPGILPARGPMPPSASTSWRSGHGLPHPIQVHSPLNPNPHPHTYPYPQPNPAYASSVSSFAPSTVSTYNTRLSNGSMRSLSTVATTMSDPTSVKSRWSGLKDPSIRSTGSMDMSAASIGGNSKGKDREMPASPLGKGGRMPRSNVKRIEGMPAELDDLPRSPFKAPTPAQKIVHNESKRSLPRKPSTPSRLEAIDERERERAAAAHRERERESIEKAVSMVFQRPEADAPAPAITTARAASVFQRRDASTSTTSLSSVNGVGISPSASMGTLYEERGTPGRAKQGQILTLGKILRGLGNREAREAREARN